MNYTGKVAWALGTGVVVALFCSGCQRPSPKFGPEYNAQRATLGIPPVPLNWLVYSSVFEDRTNWANPLFSKGMWNKRTGIHGGKSVAYERSMIIDEVDEYYSGREFNEHEEGFLPEKMYVTFSHVAERAGKEPWTFDVWRGPEKGLHSAEEALGILRKWGIPEIELPAPVK